MVEWWYGSGSSSQVWIWGRRWKTSAIIWSIFAFQVEQQEFPFQFTEEQFPFQFQTPEFPRRDEDLEDLEDSNIEKNPDCGLLCLVFKLVVPVVKTMKEEIGDIVHEMHQKSNEVDAVEDDGEYHVNNSTYSQKVKLTF